MWTAQGWRERFGLPFEAGDTGYGHTPEQVAQVRGLERRTSWSATSTPCTPRRWTYVRPLTPDDLDRVVDERWDPPVTLGVRLVSVVNDDQQHVGQAAFVRGLLDG